MVCMVFNERSLVPSLLLLLLLFNQWASPTLKLFRFSTSRRIYDSFSNLIEFEIFFSPWMPNKFFQYLNGGGIQNIPFKWIFQISISLVTYKICVRNTAICTRKCANANKWKRSYLILQSLFCWCSNIVMKWAINVMPNWIASFRSIEMAME